MTVETTATATTPAADVAPAAGADTGATEGAADENLLGDVAEADASEPAAEGADAAKEEGDDLLEGKVGEKEKDEAAEADDYELVAPEGYELDADLTQSFKPVAKELGLSKEQAQGLVEKFGPQMLTQIGEKQAAQWKEIQKGWAKEAKADADVFDAKANAVRPEIAKARDFLGPEFTGAIKLLGGNNHPSVLKALAKIGKALSEDTPGHGSPPKAALTREQVLYPNDQPK